MTTKTWSGAVDGNWQTAGNWVGGVAPVATDDIVFNSGSISCNAGLTGNVYALGSLTVTENYTGSIGSGATALTVTDFTSTPNAGGIKCSGRGSFYKFACTGTTTHARIDTKTGNTVYLSSGTFTNVYHSGSGGEAKFESAVVTNYYGTNNAIAMTADAATAFTLCYTAGRAVSSRSIGTFLGKGGCNLLMVSAAAITTSATLHKGDVYNHNSTGTITLLDVGPGASFPLAIATKDFVITNTNQWQGGFINTNPASITVTYTNPIAMFGYGPPNVGGFV